MKEKLKRAMMDAISNVFETMFFLPMEFSQLTGIENFLRVEEKGVLTCILDFNGPFSGKVVLFIPAVLAIPLTADFMGVESDTLSKDHVTGTVKEIVNMIAGSMFINYDDKSVFDLAIPKMATFEKACKEDPASKESLFLGVKTPDSKFALKIELTHILSDN